MMSTKMSSCNLVFCERPNQSPAASWGQAAIPRELYMVVDVVELTVLVLEGVPLRMLFHEALDKTWMASSVRFSCLHKRRALTCSLHHHVLSTAAAEANVRFEYNSEQIKY